MMASIQERLQRKREPLDKWSIREQLCLAFAVSRIGDQNWISVSRALKPFGDPNRPADWFHQKNCAAQYGALLENVETPKRKKRISVGVDIGNEVPSEFILRKLKVERVAELKQLMEEEKAEYLKLQEEMALLKSGNLNEDKLDLLCKQIDEEDQLKEKEAILHSQWLKERETRKLEIERSWRPIVKVNVPVTGQKRKASDSIDALSDVEGRVTPTHTPETSKPALSPLLTSLLKSPSQAQNIVTSSILHTAITSQRPVNTNPTIARLLSTSDAVQVSPGLEQLVTTAITAEPTMSKNTITDLLDAADPLPNLKVEDILSADDPLPEIKNEEVDVIISDLIESADIVTDPEQHLLDGNDDIITDFENELEELVNEEKAAEAKAAARVAAEAAAKAEEAETAAKAVIEAAEKAKLETEVTEKETPIKTIEPEVTTEENPNSIDLKPDETKENQNDVDPFEFQEDPEIFEPAKAGTNAKPASTTPTPEEETQTLLKETEIKVEAPDESPTKDKEEIVPGSVEIVEVIVMEDEEIDKELNKTQIQDIVHSSKVEPAIDEIKEEPIEIKEDIKTDKDDTVSIASVESLELELKQEENSTEAEEPSRRNVFTPEYSEDFDLEVTKTENKAMKVKRDYSRPKKKEESDFDILLAVEQAVNANLEEDTESSGKEDDKKSDVEKPKLKIENERSNSPWTEEEDTVRTRRRYSTPQTPSDSVPNSPASSTNIDDDKDYRNWKKATMLVFNRLANHKNASLFLKPITNTLAPGYHDIIKKPMDLQTLRKNIDGGTIRTTAEFQRDLLLIFTNAIMYNKSGSMIYKMAEDILQEASEQIKLLKQVQTETIPARRETRTSEGPGSKRKRITEELPRGKRRKED